MKKRATLAEVLPYIDAQNIDDIIKFIQTDDKKFLPLIPDDIYKEILRNDDLKTDISWYLEIKDRIKIEDFSCIHLAYASSDKLNNIINKENSLYVLRYNPRDNEGIVIGHCPWCGKKLNTSLHSQS